MGDTGRIGTSRWVRRAVVPTVAAGALVLGLGGWQSASASGVGGAHKLALTQTNRSCAGSQIGDTQAARHGFVNLVMPAGRKLVAAVVLKDARPSTTYNVRLIQLVPGGTDCAVVDGTVTTDSDGDGSTNVQEKLLPGATGVWVAVNEQADFTQFYATAPLSF